RLNTATIGPPVSPAPATMSLRPSPVTSPTPTVSPPRNDGSNPKKLLSRMPSGCQTVTTGPPPLPAPQTMSSRPSPSMSPTATFTPPVNDGSNALNWLSRLPPVSNTRTTGGEPGPDPVAYSIPG